MALRTNESISSSRVPSVDALRGFVMIVMALDHTRDFFHAAALAFQPDDLTRTTTILFFTRWITHFCAPVFMFTAGLGAFLWYNRGRTKAQLSRFLWTRGLWLVVLELTALRLAMSFDFSGPVLLTILWALGWSMVALGFLIYLPLRVLACLSVAVIALHNLADAVSASQFGGAAWIWNILHQQGIFHAGTTVVLVAYPLVPWIFVMAAGFCFGPVIALPALQRRRWMARIGLALTAAFLLIRALNIYGDPVRWSTQFPGMTVLSFLRVTKYPPSLDFLLMTLGPALLLLAWFDRVSWSATNPLIVFGRVPLFYFLVHFYLIHALAVMLQVVPHGGYALWVVYVVWLAVVAMMYPVSLWYSRLKQRKHSWWLSYL